MILTRPLFDLDTQFIIKESKIKINSKYYFHKMKCRTIVFQIFENFSGSLLRCVLLTPNKKLTVRTNCQIHSVYEEYFYCIMRECSHASVYVYVYVRAAAIYNWNERTHFDSINFSHAHTQFHIMLPKRQEQPVAYTDTRLTAY